MIFVFVLVFKYGDWHFLMQADLLNPRNPEKKGRGVVHPENIALHVTYDK